MILAQAVYADQLVPQFGRIPHRRVDPLCQSREVQVKSTEDDSGVVIDPVAVQLAKVAAIVRQKDPALSRCKRQNLGVRDCGVCPAGFHRGQYIMSQTPQFPHNLQCDILV